MLSPFLKGFQLDGVRISPSGSISVGLGQEILLFFCGEKLE